jgi:hypothetical protein
MRLVSLPTLVRTLAIFLASLQAARVGAVQAQTFGEVPPQASPVSAPPLHASPLSGYSATLPAHPALPPDKLDDHALPTDDPWLVPAMVGTAAAARSPRTSRTLALVAHARSLDADEDHGATGLRSTPGSGNHTSQQRPSAHRPRAPCLLLT